MNLYITMRDMDWVLIFTAVFQREVTIFLKLNKTIILTKLFWNS